MFNCQPRLGFDPFLRSITIPLPPLPEQRRIAAILDAADALRRHDKALLQRYDDLTQSVFHEMFGDPVKNEKGWEVKKLDLIAEIKSGVTKGRKLDGKSTVTVPYLRVANVQDGYLDLTEIKSIDVLPDDVKRYRLERGDILLTEGGDPDKLGRGAVWDRDADQLIHQNHVFRVRIGLNKAIPLFLSKQIGSSYGKRYFLKSAKQTTGIASINKTQLSNFPCQLPPLPLQQQFATRVEAIERQKSLVQESLAKSEALFGSLMQKAFKGEL